MADVTAPAVFPSTVYDDSNGGTPIVPAQIPTPIDDTTPTGDLTVTIDSIIYGSLQNPDGSPVSVGQQITVAQLTALQWTGFSFHLSTPYQSSGLVTYSVSDQSGNIGIGAATVVQSGMLTPVLSGSHTSITYGQSSLNPFTGVNVINTLSGAGSIDGAGMLQIIVLGSGTLSGTGLIRDDDGSYQLIGENSSILTQELDALTYRPAANDVGNPRTIVVTATFGSARTIDLGTTIIDRPASDISDAISFSPNASYSDGVFTLAGKVSSSVGVRSVELSALVDGVPIDLGEAVLDTDGNFTFSNKIGSQSLSLITATEIDNAGSSASAQADYSLMGGLPGNSGVQDTFNGEGSALLLSTHFAATGQRTVSVEAPNQTVDLQPFDLVSNHHKEGTNFVFTPGDGLDVISGFRVGTANHSTLVLPSSDFQNFADVLRNTGDVQGSAFITDPKTGDAIRLAGVSTAQLRTHQQDFAFM